MSQRTLLMVSPYFPPALGGLEQYVFRVSSQLRQRHDWRVVVVTSGDRHGEDRHEVIDELTVHRLGYRLTASNTPFDLRWARRMRQIVRECKPDIVNAHLPVPGIADVVPLAGGNVPLVVTYHSASMRKGRLLYDVPIWAYERIAGRALLTKARRIICTSAAAQDFLRHYRRKSVVIPPGVDVRVFHPGHAPGQVAMTADAGRLLFVSNLSRSHAHKGLGYLLRALSDPRCREVCLDVVGDGDGRADYQAQCVQLGIANRVTFHGARYGEELAGYYRAAFCLVQPSTNDSLPTTIIEAMACGCPVIASRIGSTATLVRPETTGYLVEPGDSTSLAAAIADLYADPSRAATYGKAALDLIQSNYTTEHQAERTHALFERALCDSS